MSLWRYIATLMLQEADKPDVEISELKYVESVMSHQSDQLLFKWQAIAELFGEVSRGAVFPVHHTYESDLPN